MLEIFALAAALAVLVKASSFTITNAAKFSKASGISQVAVGFIFIAVATSLPELSIAVMSSLSGDGALSMGNLIGADIVNITLIFGLMAVAGFKIKKPDTENISLAVILVSIVSVFLIVLKIADFTLGIFLIIVFWLFSSIVLGKGVSLKNEKAGSKNARRYALLTLAGVALVVASARFVTDYSILLASMSGVSETLIGATILSLGTTLPELSVNLTALRRRNIGLAIGDSIGSIVTNMTLVLGIASVIGAIPVGKIAFFSLAFLIFSSFLFLFMANRLNFGRKEGVVLLIAYAAYLLIVLRV